MVLIGAMTKRQMIKNLLTFFGVVGISGGSGVSCVVGLFGVFGVAGVSGWQEFPSWYNELFGDGDFHEKSAKETVKHLSRQLDHKTKHCQNI